MYLAPQNIPRAISVLTLGNKVILYCIVSDNEVENNGLASSSGPVESVNTLDGIITVSEVQNAIKALRDNKATGPDGLNSN